MDKNGTVGIAGTGTMGAPMAEAFAKAGFPVLLYDIDERALDRAKRLIALNHETEVEHGNMTAGESRAIQERIAFTAELGGLKKADFLVEAIPENLEVKHAFWAQVSALVADGAILCTNTSGLSVTKIAEAVKNPRRFAGMHWVNPAHIIPLVEVISGKDTSPETAEAVCGMARRLRKKPVKVNDAPGFVLNRLQFAVMREALNIVERGIASPEGVDDVMKNALGFRYACLGPFEVADLGGLDVFHNIASYLFADLSRADADFGLMKAAFEKGQFGVKSGAGFYDYSGGKAEASIKRRDRLFTRLAECLFGG